MRNIKELKIEGQVVVVKELTIKQIKKLASLVFDFTDNSEDLKLDMSLYEKVINVVPDCINYKNKEKAIVKMTVDKFEDFTFSEAELIFEKLLQVNDALVKKLKRFGVLQAQETQEAPLEVVG